MNVVIRHTEYLVSRKDCVIIPGFGAVLANYVPARYDDATFTMYPPSRVMTFNRDLRVNDGALACSVARSEQISYDAALSRIEAEVNAMNHQLTHHGELALGKIGTLQHDPENGTVTFSPRTTDLLSANTAWLPAIEVKPIITSAKEEHETESTQIATARISPMRRFMRVAASLALLVGVCFVVSTPVSVDNAAMASLSPKIQSTPIEELVPQLPEPAPIVLQRSSSAEQLYIDVDTASRYSYQAYRKAAKSNRHAAAAIPAGTDDGAYCVIVSSHTTRDEAMRFTRMHQSDNLRILEKDGRFRVYAASFPTSSQASTASRQIAKRYAGAWVCKR